jgi:PAS domain S-box-containing protein
MPSSPEPLTKKSPRIDLQGEEVFRTLVASVRDYAIFVLDPTGIIASWNPGAQRLKLYEPEEIIGKHFSVFYPEVDIRNGKPEMELRVAGETGRFEDEGWRLRKDGSRFWANVVITAIRDKHGTLIGFGKITRDLTDRRIAEQRYRLLVEGVTDYAIYSLDPHGNVTSWNSGAERIKGYTADQIIGQHFSKFYTPEDAAAGMPSKVLNIAERESHFEGEGWRVRKDGSRFWSSVVVTALRDEEGRLTGFSKVTRDITDRKRLLDELRRHAQDLETQIAERERTNAELEAFGYSVSHDLRAPLRAIEGFASALREDYGAKLDATATDYLDQIMRAATRMNRLIKDLLEYGRLNRIAIQPEAIVVRPLLERVIAETVPEGTAVRLSADTSVHVAAHETTLTQVLTNLLSNAVKFTKAGEKADVSFAVTPAERDGFVRIAVKDKGIGIAPQHLDRIFNMFERLHGIEEYPGTGIGLAIVKRGVERMNGTVGVESRLGEGSTFWIELPQPGTKETTV